MRAPRRLAAAAQQAPVEEVCDVWIRIVQCVAHISIFFFASTGGGGGYWGGGMLDFTHSLQTVSYCPLFCITGGGSNNGAGGGSSLVPVSNTGIFDSVKCSAGN